MTSDPGRRGEVGPMSGEDVRLMIRYVGIILGAMVAAAAITLLVLMVAG